MQISQQTGGGQIDLTSLVQTTTLNNNTHVISFHPNHEETADSVVLSLCKLAKISPVESKLCFSVNLRR